MRGQEGFIEVTAIIFILIVVFAVMLTGGAKMSESIPLVSPTPISGTVLTGTPAVSPPATQSAQTIQEAQLHQ